LHSNLHRRHGQSTTRYRRATVVERLFLEGFQTDEHDTMSVVIDLGDLDQLIVELDSDGCGRRVFRPP
jgi:hypothetical protein